MDEAALELTNTMPTTMAGVLALRCYIRDFNNHKISAPGRSGSYTEHEQWSDFASDDGNIEMPAPYFLMENALAALEQLASAAGSTPSQR